MLEANKYYPLDLDKVNGGEQLREVNEDIQLLERSILAYVRRHGADAEGAKASLTLKIVLTCEDPRGPGTYSVSVEPTMSLPKRPKDVSIALVEEGDDGQPHMVVKKFARASGERGPQLPFGLKPGEKIGEGGEVHSADDPQPPARQAP